MKKSTPPKIEVFPTAKQRKLDQLLQKNSDGTITDKERAKLQLLVAEAEELMVSNARRLANFSSGSNPKQPSDNAWQAPRRFGNSW